MFVARDKAFEESPFKEFSKITKYFKTDYVPTDKLVVRVLFKLHSRIARLYSRNDAQSRLTIRLITLNISDKVLSPVLIKFS